MSRPIARCVARRLESGTRPSPTPSGRWPLATRYGRIGTMGLAIACLLIGPFWAWAQAPKPGGAQGTAPRPKWDARVLKIFVPNAKDLVGPGQPGGGGAVRPMNSGGNPGTQVVGPASSNTPAAGGSGTGWSKLISSDVLEAEIKTSINGLSTAVETAPKYAQTYSKARRQFSMLAILFGVAADYDGDVKWKNQAAGLRDVIARAGFNSKVGTSQAFTEAKARLDDLKDLVSGNGISVPDSQGPVEWGKVADRSELMKRMEDAGQTHLGAWTASQAEFNANKDQVKHEAELLAMLAEVIQQPGYEYADDESYLKHAVQLRDACVQIVDAVKLNNYDQARTAAGNMSKACANCHTDFR